jgi:glycosyltransferase involved in cell wall biosynthesis
MQDAKNLIVAMVADNASRKMGGEARKVLVYKDKFLQRGIRLYLVCHSRSRQELENELTYEELQSIRFIEDTQLQKLIFKVSKPFPDRIQGLLFFSLISILFQIKAREAVLELIRQEGVNVVFQPTPNSPLVPSAMYDLGVPVVFGPLTGGMEFPPNFRHMDTAMTHLSLKLGKFFASTFYRWMPGKLKASAILVSNSSTKALLPKQYRGRIYDNILESGVDLSCLNTVKNYDIQAGSSTNAGIKYVFVGRLIDWKGVSYLINAFQEVEKSIDGHLYIVGDGALRPDLEGQVKSLNLQNKVTFMGWMQHDQMLPFLIGCDVFIMPSLRESGGNALLEAMALGLPVIATNWGGPGRIVDDSCGLRVEPSSPEEFEQSLAQEMIRLGRSPELRRKLGMAGRKRCTAQYFDWDTKVNFIIEILEGCVNSHSSGRIGVDIKQDIHSLEAGLRHT